MVANQGVRLGGNLGSDRIRNPKERGRKGPTRRPPQLIQTPPEGDTSALAFRSAPWSTAAKTGGTVFAPLSFEAIIIVGRVLRNHG